MLLNAKALHARIVCTIALAILGATSAQVSATPLESQPARIPDALEAVGDNIAAEGALVSASPDARYALRWVMSSRDNQGLPFVMVDKKGGRIFVFEATGQLRGVSPVLTGLTPGDHAVPGMAQRSVGSLRVDERTTPAGRFVSEPGHNLQGEAIVWIDYTAKLAIHRLRPAAQAERRAERLASETPDDNRISLGCVVVPVSFYETVVGPVLGKSRGVVYILPETQPVQRMLGALQFSQR
ncbi:MAG: hypothetical protein ABI893_01625 [Polaromonas sp.]|uniref:hypothetical protein n=1 Tax=Polaromonas sp. TaxID=1869339 RepID=UPI003262E87E